MGISSKVFRSYFKNSWCENAKPDRAKREKREERGILDIYSHLNNTTQVHKRDALNVIRKHPVNTMGESR